MKTQLIMIVTGAISLFGLSSCFQVESTITVRKDGSGTISEKMILGEQMKMMLAQAGAGGEDPMAQMLDQTKAEARAKTMGEGVEVVSVEKIDANGELGVKTTFRFADINKLKYSLNDAMDTGDAGGNAADEGKDGSLTFKLADGRLTIIQKAPQGDANDAGGFKMVDGKLTLKPQVPQGDAKDAKPEQPEIDPQQLAMMQGMMKDMRVTTKVVIEAGINSTDATYVDGDTIILSDIRMGKLLADPEKLKSLQGGGFDQMKKALKGVEGIKFEDKDSITVEMK